MENFFNLIDKIFSINVFGNLTLYSWFILLSTIEVAVIIL